MRLRIRSNRNLVALTSLISMMAQPLALAQQPANVTQAGQRAAAPTQRKAPATSATSAKASSGKTQPMKLFGRIDQIAGEPAPEMPVLKLQQAVLDTPSRPAPRRAPTLRAAASETKLRAAANETKYSGSITKSFPTDFSGTWGGTIKVWRHDLSALSYERDSAESRKLRDILTPGTPGDVNFVFQQEGDGTIDLDPTVVRILIPASQSYSYQKMMQNGSMNGMASEMMANMKVPVILHFGYVSTRAGGMETGVSGNQIEQNVVKNDIRQLAPDVIEEQIVTRNKTVQTAGSGRTEQGYTESVLRFTKQSNTQLFVLAASVEYDKSGKFLRKLIMSGTVIRGQVMNTSPVPEGMGNLTQMMGGQQGRGNSGSANGAAGLSGILNGMGGGSQQQSNWGTNSTNGGNSGGSTIDINELMNRLNNR